MAGRISHVSCYHLLITLVRVRTTESIFRLEKQLTCDSNVPIARLCIDIGYVSLTCRNLTWKGRCCESTLTQRLGSSSLSIRYQETRSPLYKRWRRTCSPEQAFPSFVRFLKLKNWCRLS